MATKTKPIKLRADEIRVSVENGQWVAKFYSKGVEQWVLRAEDGAPFHPENQFRITGIEVTTEARLVP